ncbi:MAG: hypothetical protein V4642_03415 [Bacteroidota bacterium]
MKMLLVRIVVIFFIGFVVSFGQSEKYRISERVGDGIDADERVYFGLFYDIGRFVSARAEKNADSITIIITRKERNDTNFTISFKDAEEIKSYIENAEEPERFKANPVVRKYVRISEIEPADGKVVRVTSEGRDISGRLLFVNDSLLGIWKNSEKYSWREAEKNIQVISFQDIDKIHFKDRPLLNTSVKAGTVATAGALGWYIMERISRQYNSIDIVPSMLLGAGYGALYGYTQYSDIIIGRRKEIFNQWQSILESESIINNTIRIPPEVKRSIETAEALKESKLPITDEETKTYMKRFHLSLGLAAALPDIKSPTEINLTRYFGYTINAEYSITRRLRIGAEFLPGKLLNEPFPEDQDFYAVRTLSGTVYGVFIINSPLVLSPAGFETSIALGATVTNASVNGRLTYPAPADEGIQPQPPLIFEKAESLIGWMIGGSVGYYVTPSVSYHVSVRQHVVPDFVTPKYDASVENFGRKYSNSIPALSHNLTATVLYISGQFHF